VRIRDGPQVSNIQGRKFHTFAEFAVCANVCLKNGKLRLLEQESVMLSQGSIPCTQPMQAKVACRLWFPLSWSAKHE
jgi:hypothetical protein